MRFFVRDKRAPTRHAAGLTLIEIVVSVGIFVLLIGLVGGTYFTMVRTQGEQIQVQHAIGDINNFFEILDREIRTGYGHTFEEDVNELELVNQHGYCVRYELVNKEIHRTEWDGWNATVEQCGNPSVSSNAITSKRTDIQHVSFGPVVQSKVSLNGFTHGRQGSVTVLVGACPRDLDGVTSWQEDGRCVAVQTTITSRQFSVFNP